MKHEEIEIRSKAPKEGNNNHFLFGGVWFGGCQHHAHGQLAGSRMSYGIIRVFIRSKGYQKWASPLRSAGQGREGLR